MAPALINIEAHEALVGRSHLDHLRPYPRWLWLPGLGHFGYEPAPAVGLAYTRTVELDGAEPVPELPRAGS